MPELNLGFQRVFDRIALLGPASGVSVMEFTRTRGFSADNDSRRPSLDLSDASIRTDASEGGGGGVQRRDSDVSLYVDLTKTGASSVVNVGNFPSPNRSTVYIDLTTLSLTMRQTFNMKTFRSKTQAARDQAEADGTAEGETKAEPASAHDADYDKQVASGYLMCAAARSPFAVLMVNFVAPVVLTAAQGAAAEEGGRLGGFLKASNIFSALYLIFALLVILMGPPLGALTDFTRHRKTLLSCLLVLMNASCLLLLVVGTTPDAWVGVSALLVLTLVCAELVGVPILAYLPEVTSDHARSTAVASASTIVFVLVCLCFTGVALATGSFLHLSDVDRVRTACGLAVAFSLPFSIAAIVKMPARGPSQQWQSESPLLLAGFEVLYRSMSRLWSQHPSLARFILARAFYQAGQRSLAALATTYLVVQLAMAPGGVTLVMTLALLAGIPGALLAMGLRGVLRGRGPLLAVLLLMAISVGACPLLLTGQGGSPGLPYAFSALWGMAIGFAGSYDQALFAGLVPAGQEAELSGLFVFSNSALEWLPPLVFSLCNQGLGSLRWALASLVPFYLVALALLLTVTTTRTASSKAGPSQQEEEGGHRQPPSGGGAVGEDQTTPLHLLQRAFPAMLSPIAESSSPFAATQEEPMGQGQSAAMA